MKKEDNIKNKIINETKKKIELEIKIKQDEQLKHIESQMKEINYILDLIKNRLLYKKQDRFNHKYIVITEEIFYKDFTNTTDNYNKGIKVTETDSWGNKVTLSIKVNGEYYHHIGEIMFDFENELKNKKTEIMSLNARIRDIEKSFGKLIAQENVIKEASLHYQNIIKQLNHEMENN